MKLNKVTFAAMAVLALVAQPFYAVIASQSASAAGLTVVSPATPQGWVASSANGASVTYASGDSTVGLGALRLTTSSDNESYAKMTRSENMLLSQLTQLSYATKQLSAADMVNGNATMRINIDTDGDGTLDDQLMYEPYYNGFNGTTMTGWQNWNVKEGKFWSNYETTYNGLGGVAAGSYASNFTLSDVMHDYPAAKVVGIVLGMGTWNSSQVVLADDVVVNDTQYDFDPTPYVPTTPPTRPSLSGEVIYDSIPTVLPSNSPSLGYEATSTRAFGDKITFAGEGRELDSVAVNLSSWACESGSWNNGGCVTTPGATFNHPVTLNIYNVAEDGTVGSLIASRTQTFAIPYRPTADSTCDTPSQWRDTNGNCFNGLNHVVVFNAAGITVPNTVIYSVAYNTQNYGEAPIGVAGPYSSLNVALSSSTNVGTNNDEDELFWDTTYPGYTSGLKADSGWGESGNPAVIFTAKKAQVVDEDDASNTNSGTNTSSGNGELPRTGGSGASNTGDGAVVAVSDTSATPTTTQASEVLGTDEATGESLSAQDSKTQKEWSFINLLLSGIVATMAVITFAGIRGAEGSTKWLRIAAIIPAVAAIVTLLIVEDFGAKIGLVNGWTLLFVGITALQAGLLFAAKKPSEE